MTERTVSFPRVRWAGWGVIMLALAILCWAVLTLTNQPNPFPSVAVALYGLLMGFLLLVGW